MAVYTQQREQIIHLPPKEGSRRERGFMTSNARKERHVKKDALIHLTTASTSSLVMATEE